MTDSPDSKCPDCGSMNFSIEGEEVTCDDCGAVLKDKGETAGGRDFNSRVGSPIGWKDTEAFQSLKENRDRDEKKRAEKVSQLVEETSDFTMEWERTGLQLVDTVPNGVILRDSSSVFSVDAETGETVWSLQLPSSTEETRSDRPTVVIRGELLFVARNQDLIVADVATGEEQWRTALPTRTSENRVGNRIDVTDGAVYILFDDDSLVAYSRHGGSVLWEAPHSDKNMTSRPNHNPQLVLINDLVVSTDSSDDSSAIARDATTGDVVWEFLLRDSTSLLAVAAGHVVVGSTLSGKVYALDPQTGEQRWRYALSNFRGPAHDDGTPELSPLIDVREVPSGLLLTGDGHYSAIVDPETGEYLHEIYLLGNFDTPYPEYMAFDTPLEANAETHKLILVRSLHVIQAYRFTGHEESYSDFEQAKAWRFADPLCEESWKDKFRAIRSVAAAESAQQLAVYLGPFTHALCTVSLADGELLNYVECDDPVHSMTAVGAHLIVDHSHGSERYVRSYRL